MLYGWWIVIKSKIVWVLSGLVTVAAFVARLQYLKKTRDALKFEKKVLEATLENQRANQKIIKEEEVQLSSRKAKIKEEIENKKKLDKGDPDAKPFKGIDNLTDSNDW
jgi:predicted Holliday junction resolvase-like endonuclease